MNIMFMGVDFYPYHTPSDKNFWLSIVNEASKQCQNVQIISCVNSKPDTHIDVHGNIVFHYFRFLSFLLPYSLVGGTIARLILFCVNSIKIKRIMKQNNIQIVHFVDNFVIAMPLMKILYRNVRIIGSIAAARPKSKAYDLLLRISYGYLDKIVTFTKCLREKLVAIGVDEDKIEVIRWGVRTSAREETSNRCHNKDNRVLWTGFLSQVREEDFLLAIRIAKRLTFMTDKCEFVFCFKPHFFDAKYREYEDTKIRIQPDISFDQIVDYSDIYFCPIENQNKIIGPPLTWIEMMSRGKPVVTTMVGGALEIVKNGENGYICRDEQETVRVLLDLVAGEQRYYEKMSRHAKDFIRDNFDLKNACQRYLELWKYA